MIEEFGRQHEIAETVRLASLPRERIQAVLLRRGIAEESIDDAVQSMADLGTPLTLEEAVSFPFRANAWRSPPFGSGRFHDGTQFGVYYSALDAGTCFSEIGFHLQKDGLEQSLAYPKYYFLIGSRFEGDAVDLIGHVERYPQLISEDESGYPLCWRISSEAVQNGVAALKTRSARKADGICFPVFSEQALSAHQIVRSIRIRNNNDEIDIQDL